MMGVSDGCECVSGVCARHIYINDQRPEQRLQFGSRATCIIFFSDSTFISYPVVL